jgi:hypothetical protein
VLQLRSAFREKNLHKKILLAFVTIILLFVSQIVQKKPPPMLISLGFAPHILTIDEINNQSSKVVQFQKRYVDMICTACDKNRISTFENKDVG